MITMGSHKDVMILFAERDLRRFFSEYDGWNLAPLTSAASTGCLYRASRNRVYHDETAFISVSFDPVPTEESILALESLPSSRGSRVRKYLLTPQATNTRTVPPHVGILLMDAFAFTAGELIWLTRKKNARQYPPAPPAPAPAS
jgi:hypothetical protein